MKTLKEVHEYLNDVGFFYLSTVDREKPKCRPMGVHMLIDGQLYFAVGNFKNTYAQMLANPYVEITAAKRPDWIRVFGKAVFETDDKIAESLLTQYPALRNIYCGDRKLKIFHLEQATAQFRSMLEVEEEFHF